MTTDKVGRLSARRYQILPTQDQFGPRWKQPAHRSMMIVPRQHGLAPATDAAQQWKGRHLEQVVKLGRGNFPSSEVAMARELIEICADAEGWRVLARDTDFKNAHYTKFQAIQHASTIAAARHKNTGRSTGVSVATPSGRSLMVALCG